MSTPQLLRPHAERPAGPLAHGVSPIRRLAWLYALMFLGVGLIGYVPGLTDSQGRLLGLFSLQWYDNALHLASAIWAAAAAWASTRAALLYFRIFGVVYFFDGVVGFLTGQGYLDGGIFLAGPTPLPFATRLGANIPHLLIGGVAILIGYVFSRRLVARA